MTLDKFLPTFLGSIYFLICKMKRLGRVISKVFSSFESEIFYISLSYHGYQLSTS